MERREVALRGKTERNRKKREKLKAQKRIDGVSNQMAALNPTGDFSFLADKKSKDGPPSIPVAGNPTEGGAPKKRGVNTISPEGVNVVKKSRHAPTGSKANAPQATAAAKAPQAKAGSRDNVAGPYATKNPDQKRLDGRAGDNLAVLLYDAEGGRIEEPESEEILSTILCKIDELPDDSGNIGCSSPPVLEDGKITVYCVNAATRDWLMRVVGTLSTRGRDLLAARWDEWEGKSKIRVFFPTNPGPPDRMLLRIQKQNACVTDTSQWKVLSCKDADGGKGKIALLLLPREAAKAVKVAGNKLLCDFMTAKVTHCGDGGQSVEKAVAASKT